MGENAIDLNHFDEEGEGDEMYQDEYLESRSKAIKVCDFVMYEKFMRIEKRINGPI